jgi:hypothetical protein
MSTSRYLLSFSFWLSGAYTAAKDDNEKKSLATVKKAKTLPRETTIKFADCPKSVAEIEKSTLWCENEMNLI